MTLICSVAVPQTRILRIAIIDSGFNKTTNSKLKLCPDGHKDFTGFGEFQDAIGHGTHIANIIGNRTSNVHYCAIIIKYTHDPVIEDKLRLPFKRSIAAFRYLLSLDVDVINYSSGGLGSPVNEEKQVLSLLRKKGVSIFVAAGNDSTDLNETCYYWPACHKIGLNVIGNLGKDLKRNKSSNYGNKAITQWEMGTDIKAEVSERIIMGMTGTSQATAIATSKFINGKK